jgi:hypothetical protein
LIPRIGAVADVYDALSTERPYKPAMPLEQALGLLFREAKAGQLDLKVVQAFESVAEAWRLRVGTDPDLRGANPLFSDSESGVVDLRLRTRPDRASGNDELVA